jgi:hypothetical protein
MWRSTFLSAHGGTCAERSDKDACAAKIAWASIKKKFRKGKDGKWVAKDVSHRAGDPVVGPISPVPDPISAPLFGTGFDLTGPGEKGTKNQQWRAEFARALANECRNSDHPVECARSKANAAVGRLEERMEKSNGDHPEIVGRRTFTADERRELAKKGHALSDGSFPITSCSDVRNAVGSLGRTDQPRKRVIRHIRKRAKDIGCRMTPAIKEKVLAVERYLERKDRRKHANDVDFQHITTLGDTPIDRPDHFASEIWRTFPAEYRTVRAEATRRIIERNYAQAVEDAEMAGWKPHRSPYHSEEYFLSKRWPSGDGGKVVIRALLVRRVDALHWEIFPISEFASGSLAAKLPKGVVRHVKDQRNNIPLIESGGPGSGHFGHAGRPGEVGGSQDGDAASGEAGRRVTSPRPDSDAATAENQAESREPAAPTLAERLPEMSLSAIAREVRKDWKKVNFAAVPYLEALGSLNSIDDNFMLDSGASVVAYFLSNAGTWKGDTARAVKAELKKRLSRVYG